MSTADMEYQPGEREQQVLDVLREHGRANPMLIREETGLRKGYVSRALTGLQKGGVVEKVARGLYNHVLETDDEFRNMRQSIDVAATRSALDELETALDARNQSRAEEALDRARRAVQEDSHTDAE